MIALLGPSLEICLVSRSRGRREMGGKGKKPVLSDHLLTVRRRLHEALSLGMSASDGKLKKWQSKDSDTQLHALKTMAAFLNCMTLTLLQHPLLQDSVSDTVVALGGILQSDNERTLNLAADVTQKLVFTLGSAIHQYPMLDAISSLSHLLSLSQLPASISFTIALNHILKNLGSTKGKILEEVWNDLEKANSVGNIICALLQNDVVGTQQIDYFLAMASLLESILRKWPVSRYPVWSNNKLMANLRDKCMHSETSIVVGAFKLCSAIALCGNGAVNLLKNKDFLSVIIQNLGISQPFSVRIEALKLWQHLSRSEDACSFLTDPYSEPLVQGIIGAMGGWKCTCSKRVPVEQLPLVLEACRAALLTCRTGNHHSHFWKHKIDRILLDILLGDCMAIHQHKVALSSDELMAIINDNTADIRAFVWDILGNLAVYCEEIFLPKTNGALCYLNFLISCACSVATVLMRRGFISLSFYMNELEPVCRAVLLMVFSPCQYISSQARYYLAENWSPFGAVFLDFMLDSLKLKATGDVSLVSDSLHTIIVLICLACYSSLPKYRKLIVEREGVSSLSAIIKMCINSGLHISRSNYAFHLHGSSYGRECCWNDARGLEGEEVMLLYSLQALSLLVKSANLVCDHHKIVSGEIVSCTRCENSDVYDIIRSLQYILGNSMCTGTRWYASYILSFFGFYGFPSKVGKRMAKAINEDELADVKLVHSKGLSLQAHAPILLARCPHLLSRSLPKKNAQDDEGKEQTSEGHDRNLRHEIRISDRVDSDSLIKVMEYVYTGFIQVDDNLTKPLKVLAKSCGLMSLYDMLNRKLPRWGTRCPSVDFLGALETSGLCFSDIILEAKSTEAIAWNCSKCQLSVPHVHAHKIMLSSCDYLRALFRSGMDDSCSLVIKAPISWRALTKLVCWFYAGDLPTIKPNCIWNNRNPEEQLQELKDYVELCSLAEYWCSKEVEEQSFNSVVSCISSLQQSSLELIQFAAKLNQWKIVAVGVKAIASLYPKMRDCCELEDLDEELVDMLRTEYIHYCQHG